MAMKKTFALLSAASALVVAGCASAPIQVANDDIDHQKIDLVNQWASHNNVAVLWVNYPRQRSTNTQ
jgi:hypothetical protein